MAYFFTDEKIVRAICDAKERRVLVSVLLDRANELNQYEGTTKMLDQCAHVLVDDKVRIQHNKLLVIDRTEVITGSFNLSRSAQRNAENVLLTEDPEMAGVFADYFRDRVEHARPLRGANPEIQGDPAVAMTVR